MQSRLLKASPMLKVNHLLKAGRPPKVNRRPRKKGLLMKVQENDNAFVYPAGDADALARHLDALADYDLRARMGQRSREIISEWNYARGVEGVKEALR